MKSRFDTRVVVVLAGLAMACAAATERPPALSRARSNPNAIQALVAERMGSPAGRGYAISAGDVIDLRVHRLDELTGRLTVADDGTIVLPLLGVIEMAGLDEREAARRIEDELREFIQHPKVTLAVAEFQGRKVSVVGAVQTPGLYPLNGFDQTIADVLAQAGGVTSDAGAKVYFLPGNGELSSDGMQLVPASNRSEAAARLGLAGVPGLLGKSGDTIEIDLTALFKGRAVPELEIPVRQGDTILVPSAGEVYVSGWVNTPGGFRLTRTQTVTKAIARAGGLHFAAAPSAVRLNRGDGNRTVKSYRINYDRILSGSDEDVYLDAGDQIEVPPNALKATAWGFYKAVTSIFGIGVGGSVPLERNDSG